MSTIGLRKRSYKNMLIKMENESGQDVEYLMPIYKEIVGLLNSIS
jgi:hypothetical protein